MDDYLAQLRERLRALRLFGSSGEGGEWNRITPGLGKVYSDTNPPSWGDQMSRRNTMQNPLNIVPQMPNLYNKNIPAEYARFNTLDRMPELRAPSEFYKERNPELTFQNVGLLSSLGMGRETPPPTAQQPTNQRPQSPEERMAKEYDLRQQKLRRQR